MISQDIFLCTGPDNNRSCGPHEHISRQLSWLKGEDACTATLCVVQKNSITLYPKRSTEITRQNVQITGRGSAGHRCQVQLQ